MTLDLHELGLDLLHAAAAVLIEILELPSAGIFIVQIVLLLQPLDGRFRLLFFIAALTQLFPQLLGAVLLAGQEINRLHQGGLITLCLLPHCLPLPP